MATLAAVGCSAGPAQLAAGGGVGDIGSPAAAPDVSYAGDPVAPDVAGPPAPPTASCQGPAKGDPSWWDEAVGYEIFVRSFQDSDGDGIGDLVGLTSRLDYLNDGDPATTDDLGVTLLWLMPIQDSPSTHGYDVVDYRAVEPDYGTLADLDALIAAAHARGIKVITDLVVNHTSSEHPWFLDARTGPGAQHRDFYVWSDVALSWDRPWGPGPTWHRAGATWYYALFWEGMPDLNFASASVRAEMTDVARFWLDRGLDGFRLDAARYLVETGPGAGQSDTAATHAYWRQLRKAVDASHADALLVGEVWTDNAIVATYFGSAEQRELALSFDFETASAVVDAIRSRSAVPARVALCARLDTYPEHASAGTFLTNHDMERLATRIDAAGPAGLRLAAAWLLTAPGTPWLYYGQEIGMLNGAGGGDEAKRLPMQWEPGLGAGFTGGVPWRSPQSESEPRTVAGQIDDPQSLLSLYRTLIRLRAGSRALTVGASARVGASGTVGTPMALRRSLGADEWVLVFQFASDFSTITLTAADLPVATEFVDALDGTVYTRFTSSDDLVVPAVAPRGFRLLRAHP